MSGERVTVVLPVKDDRRIAGCLASIRRAAPANVAVEVVVIDNGSAPGFSDWLEREVRGYDWLLRVPEPGVYAARNRGAAAATGSAIFFTDADCEVLPGWFEAGLELLAEGYDLVQGFSGSRSGERSARLLQARYEKRFRRLRRGEPTEVDTRNLAVRREVFGRLQFEERYRRVGDTEFGLRAEQLGFRVGYAPAMRVVHDHDEDLRVFAAKQFCHGWGAQRLLCAAPGLAWHGGHLRLVHRLTGVLARVPGGLPAARLLWAAAFAGAAGLQRWGGSMPYRAALAGLTAVDKLALLAGHIAYAPGMPEPSPSGLLGRQLPRD